MITACLLVGGVRTVAGEMQEQGPNQRTGNRSDSLKVSGGVAAQVDSGVDPFA